MSKYKNHIKEILASYKNGNIDENTATDMLSFTEIGIANIDNIRKSRQGMPEVIYGLHKTPDQIIKIIASMKTCLITRIDEAKFSQIKSRIDLKEHHYNSLAQTLIIGPFSEEVHCSTSNVLVLCAGTSDLPVAYECTETLKYFGVSHKILADVGVAGIHRLLSNLEEIRSAAVIIAIAGMEGALPSVVAGLCDCPIIAVPTSVGYGANADGFTTLHAMLSSCGSGVTVVNIDNGFGSAVAALRIIKNN